MDEKVSVLMCVFNTGDYLCQAIDSVLGQTYPNIELILIDDASSDDSWQIMCEYSAHHPLITAVHNPVNQGMSAALNKGLKMASGDYITRQDSDDVMLPQRLAEQVAYLQQFPEVGAVGTNVTYIDTQGKEIGVSSFPSTNDAIQEALPDRMCFCGPTILVRKESFRQAGFFYPLNNSAEDYDLCLRLAEVTQMANLEQPLYLYCQRPDSFSNSNRHHQMFGKVRSLEQATQRRFGVHPPPEYIDYIARDYLRTAILGFFSDEISSGKKCLELALRYRPELLRSKTLQPPLEEIIKRYLPDLPLKDRLALVESLFQELLPQKKHLARLKSRLVAELYIVEAFDRFQMSHTPAFEPELVWMGVRHDPRWLTNRGIVSILVKQSVFRRKSRYS
jgi:glycosyltransferase involved in cell wall biosynthesis